MRGVAVKWEDVERAFFVAAGNCPASSNGLHTILQRPDADVIYCQFCGIQIRLDLIRQSFASDYMASEIQRINSKPIPESPLISGGQKEWRGGFATKEEFDQYKKDFEEKWGAKLKYNENPLRGLIQKEKQCTCPALLNGHWDGCPMKG